MKVAAYQAPLVASGVGGMSGASGAAGAIREAIERIREQVVRCEAQGVEILCCPEAILGGLADYAADPAGIALSVAKGGLSTTLAPLASERVTTIVGFTELDEQGDLYNAAAVLHRGAVLGVYRKIHPAIRRSIYRAGKDSPVFTVGPLRFGILLCNDSNFPELARSLVARGAEALFIPTNNGLPESRAPSELVALARSVDSALAVENGVPVIRADVAGRAAGFASYGSSGILDGDGTVLGTAEPLTPGLVIASIRTARGKGEAP